MPTNRRVLLVSAAHGGTPLSSTATLGWRRGVAGNLYAQALGQSTAALAAAGPNARIVAALWVQGETDGDNNTAGTIYRADPDALIAGLRTDLGISDLPFVIGQMVPEYLSTGTPAAINTVHLGTPTRLPRVAVSLAPFGLNQDDGNHFNAAAQRIIGRRMFDAFQRIATAASKPTVLATPGKVTGVVADAVTSSRLTLTWPARAQVYLVERKPTSGSSWTRVGTTTNMSVGVTGLTATTSYDFRVTASSSGGPGTASDVTTVSTTAIAPVTYFADTFARADAASLGTTEVGSKTWQRRPC